MIFDKYYSMVEKLYKTNHWLIEKYEEENLEDDFIIKIKNFSKYCDDMMIFLRQINID